VYLGSEGLIKRKEMAIPRSEVQVMGIDAWLVTNSEAVVAPEDIPSFVTLMPLNSLRGREIDTEGGTKIGSVEDIIFDDAGEVVGFVLGKIHVQGTLAERKTIARSAISTIGGTTSAMTTDLGKAEATPVPAA
jgi:sporulation protein YlmC with PRC-barrel domain